MCYKALQGGGVKYDPKKCYIIFEWPLSCRIKIGLVTVSRAGLGPSKKKILVKKFFLWFFGKKNVKIFFLIFWSKNEKKKLFLIFFVKKFIFFWGFFGQNMKKFFFWFFSKFLKPLMNVERSFTVNCLFAKFIKYSTGTFSDCFF